MSLILRKLHRARPYLLEDFVGVLAIGVIFLSSTQIFPLL